MFMSKIHLDIVTPEKKVYSEDVDMIITRAADGDIGIMPKHAPLVSPLQATIVRIKNDGQEEEIAVSGGFLEVRPDQVTILAESAETASEIDKNRALQAKERAERRIHSAEGDLIRAEAALIRSMNRLRIAK
ncbi:F-type H+-transporting ATPase subunit epsilon [Thermoactinomyces sp. DSM 45891]|nr:F-type H+-transporting ATPase subunit epsilon [Thermoactinomyces sp. DSM 45891]